MPYKNPRDRRRYWRNWCLKHLEQERIRHKIYNETHKEQNKKRSKEHYLKNKKDYLKRTKKYRQEHPEKVREYGRRNQHNNPEHVRVSSRNYRVRKLNTIGFHTTEQIKNLREKSNGICKGYKRSPHYIGKNKLVIDHIIPLYNKGSNSIENLQLLCVSCNCRKGIN